MKIELMVLLVEAVSEETLLDMLKVSLNEYLLLKTEKTKALLLMNAMMWITKHQLKNTDSSGKLIKEYDLFKKFKELSDFKNKES